MTRATIMMGPLSSIFKARLQDPYYGWKFEQLRIDYLVASGVGNIFVFSKEPELMSFRVFVVSTMIEEAYD